MDLPSAFVLFCRESPSRNQLIEANKLQKIKDIKVL